MASAGTATFSPTASINPLRTTTVPLLMTGPLTVTIFALRMATAGCDCASAKPQHSSKAVTSFFIMAIVRLGDSLDQMVTGVRRGDRYSVHSTPYTGICPHENQFATAMR